MSLRLRVDPSNAASTRHAPHSTHAASSASAAAARRWQDQHSDSSDGDGGAGGERSDEDEEDEAEAALVARMREASRIGAGEATGSSATAASVSAPAAAAASIVSPMPRGGSSSFAPATAPASSFGASAAAASAAVPGFGMASSASPASHTSSGRSLSNGGGAAAGSSGKPSPTRSPAPTAGGAGELTLAEKQAQRSQRASEGGGLLVIDSLQIEKLKLQFRNPESGKFDRALELLEFVEAFETVLGPGKSRKEFKQIFMKIDANSDGSVDWDEFVSFMLSSESSGGADPGENVVATGEGGYNVIRFERDFRREQGTLSSNSSSGRGAAQKRAASGGATGVSVSTSGSAVAVRTGSQSARSHHAGRSKDDDDDSSVGSSVPRMVPLPALSAASASRHKGVLHSGLITKLLFLPAHDRFVTCSRDGTLKFWSGSSFAHLRTIQHARCWITDMSYLRKSNRVAVCSMDRVITFYDPGSFEVVSRVRDVGASRPLVSAPTCMDSAVVHHHGSAAESQEILLVGDDLGNLLLYRFKSASWHICDGRGGVASCRHADEHTAKNYSADVTLTRMMGVHRDWITAVAYDSRLGLIITASLDRTIKQCDLNKMNEGSAAGTAAAAAAAAAAGSSATTDASASGSAPSFGLEDVVRRSFNGHRSGVYSFSYSKKFKLMASGGLQRDVLLWDPFTTKLVSTLSGHQASIAQVMFIDEYSLLLSMDFAKTIKVWSLRQEDAATSNGGGGGGSSNLKCIQTLYETAPHGLTAGRPDGNGGGGAHQHPSSFRSGRGGGVGSGGSAASASSAASRPENRLSFMHFDPHRRRLLVCSSRILVWNLSLSRSHGPRSHSAPILAVQYIPMFNQVVSGDIAGGIRVWDVDTGCRGPAFDALKRPSGSSSSSSGMDGGVDGAKLTSMTFDTGKRRLLTGSSDGRIQMWNFSNGSELMEFGAPPSAAASAASSAHSHSAGSGSSGVPHHLPSVDNEISSLAYITLEKSHGNLSKYVLATARDRRVTVYLEGEGQKHAPLFTMPPLSISTNFPTINLAEAAGAVGSNSSSSAAVVRAASGPKIATPASRRAGVAASAAPIVASSSLNALPEKEFPGHRDDILCICVCPASVVVPAPATSGSGAGSAAHAAHHASTASARGFGSTIATGSYDGSIALWHFDSQNFFAKLVPDWRSTNQYLAREAEQQRKERDAEDAAAEASERAQAAMVAAAALAGGSGSGSVAASLLSAQAGLDVTRATNPKNVAAFNAIQAANAMRKAAGAGVRFAGPAAANASGVETDKDGFTLYSPASNRWESLTPLIERAVEKLAWVSRLGLLVSVGADGLMRFWDIKCPGLVATRPARMGPTRSENLLALKVVETCAANWEDRQALQRHMDRESAAASSAESEEQSHRRSTARQPSGDYGAPSTAANDAAVKAINAIDSKPPVHYTFLFTGDSKGHLMSWDLSAFKYEYRKDYTRSATGGDTAMPLQSAMAGSASGAAASLKRAGSSLFGSTGVAVSKPLEIPVLSVPLSEAIVPLRHWQAHAHASITWIDYLASYKLLLTGGRDGRLLLWTRSGQLVGMFGQAVGSQDLHGCWDLHDPTTFRGHVEFENRSLSDTEATAAASAGRRKRSNKVSKQNRDGAGSDSGSESGSGSSSLSSSGADSGQDDDPASAAARDLLNLDSSAARRRRSRRSRRSRHSALAQAYPEPSSGVLHKVWDESPAHTPLEDEGRSRSNTPERLEEAARAAARDAKNRMSTVDSLAALGLAAIRLRENLHRKAQGLASLEEESAEAERRRIAEEGGTVAGSTESEEKTAGAGAGTGSMAMTRVGSLAASRRASVASSTHPTGSASAAAVAASATSSGPQVGAGGSKVSASFGGNKRASGALMSGLLSRGSLVTQLALAREEKQAREEKAQSVSSGTASAQGGVPVGGPKTNVPPLLLHALTHSSNTAAGSQTAPAGSGTGGSKHPHHHAHRSHRSKRSAAGATDSTAGTALNPLPAQPSALLPLLSTREGFEYFRSQIFTRNALTKYPSYNPVAAQAVSAYNASNVSAASSGAAATGATPTSSASAASGAALVARLAARESSLSERVESDEEVDIFYSNEGGHASRFYQTSRANATGIRPHGGGLGSGSASNVGGLGGGAKSARQEEADARRHRRIFGHLFQSAKFGGGGGPGGKAAGAAGGLSSPTSAIPGLASAAASAAAVASLVDETESESDPEEDADEAAALFLDASSGSAAATSTPLLVSAASKRRHAKARLTVRARGVTAGSIRRRLAAARLVAALADPAMTQPQLQGIVGEDSAATAAGGGNGAEEDATAAGQAQDHPAHVLASSKYTTSRRLRAQALAAAAAAASAAAALAVAGGVALDAKDLVALSDPQYKRASFLRDYPIVEVPYDSRNREGESGHGQDAFDMGR